jgi:hypothetical protein
LSTPSNPDDQEEENELVTEDQRQITMGRSWKPEPSESLKTESDDSDVEFLPFPWQNGIGPDDPY